MENLEYSKESYSKNNKIDGEYTNGDYFVEIKEFDFPGNKYYLIHNFKRLSEKGDKNKGFDFLKEIFLKIYGLGDVKGVYIKAENNKLLEYYKELGLKLKKEGVIRDFKTNALMLDYMF